MSADAISFADVHVAELEASGISSAVAHSAGLWSETDPSRATKLLAKKRGALGPEHMPALVFPYHRPGGGGEAYLWRIKPAVPYDPGDGDRAQKYVQASGTGVVLYWPPSLLDGERRRRDASQGLLITEGEKKTLSAESAGFACVGLGGVSNWSRRLRSGKRVLIAEFELLELDGRAVALLFDSDSAENTNVKREEQLLAERLTEAGARVRVVRLPALEGGLKCGLDDFLVAHGADALRKLIQGTRVWEPPAESKREKRERSELAQAPAIGTALTDLGNAERLVAAHGQDLLHVAKWKAWMCWDGMRWDRDETDEITRRAITTVRGMYAEAANPALDRDTARDLVDHATKSESASRLRDMTRVAQAKLPATVEDFDRDGWVFVAANGTLDLRTGELRPHSRADRCTKRSTVEWHSDADAPVWCAFLERILPDADVREFVQKMVGYALTGDISEQVLFFAHGTGKNGKSTFASVLLDVFGDYGHQAPPELLIASDGDKHPTAIAALQGRRFVVTSETKATRAFDEEVIKQITGGDRISARFMRQDFFSFEPTHKNLHLANHKPTIRQQDEGIWRRIRLIPFTVTIPDSERDLKLVDKLRAELPGILRWAVDGCLAWQNQGLRPPAAVLAATAAYREESDILAPFIETMCVLSSGASTFSAQLFQAYEAWCRRNGETPVKGKTFSMRLAERAADMGLEKTKYGGVMRWRGIGLRDGEVGEDDPPWNDDPPHESTHRDDSRIRDTSESRGGLGGLPGSTPYAYASADGTDNPPQSSILPKSDQVADVDDVWASLRGGK